MIITLKELQNCAGRHGHMLTEGELPFFAAMLRKGRTFVHVATLAERWAGEIARQKQMETVNP